MLAIVLLIAPVFAIIALGLIASKSRYIDPGAARLLAAFGYKVAMPALLFRAMANVGPVPVSPLWLAATYVAGITATWIAASIISLAILRRPESEAPAIAMGACFSNGVMLGFPLILLALGPEAATPMAFLATCETVLLWIIGTVHMGVVRPEPGKGVLDGLGGVLRDIGTNPLIIALGLGLAWRAGGIDLPEAPKKLIDLMAGAAIPVSLFALGMSLSQYPIKGELGSVAALCILKLLAYPAFAFWLATEVFALPPLWAGALVIYVAMPVGANAFIFAARYDKAVAPVSAAVAVSTLISVATVTLVLAHLKERGLILP